MKIYRHGDVILREVEAPKGKLIETVEKHTVAYGEATGHSHEIFGQQIEVWQNGAKYLRIKEPAELRHQEHGTLSIEPGIYEIGDEQERDPFEESIRKVVD